MEEIYENDYEIEHGDYHMDGEVCDMGLGNESDTALTPEEIAKLVGSEYDG